jgi:hypothetical protein
MNSRFFIFSFASIRVPSRFHHLFESIGAARPHRPTGIEEVSRKMRDTAGGTPALPSEKVASSSLFYILKNMSLTY